MCHFIMYYALLVLVSLLFVLNISRCLIVCIFAIALSAVTHSWKSLDDHLAFLLQKSSYS